MIRHSTDAPLLQRPSHDPCAAVNDGFAALASRLARWAHSLPAPQENGHAPGAHGQRAVAVGVASCTPADGATNTIGQLAAAAAAVFPDGVLVVETGPDGTTSSQWPAPLPSSDRRLSRDIPWPTDQEVQHDPILHDHILHTGHSNVWLLRPASPPRPPFEADAFWARLQPLRGSYGLMLVDLPLAGQSEQGNALAARLDGVLLVIEAERTQARVAQRIKEHLETLGARLLGVVLSGTREHLPPWLDRRLP